MLMLKWQNFETTLLIESLLEFKVFNLFEAFET